MSNEQLERAREAENLGLDPMMEKPVLELMKDIPKRLLTLLSKLIGWKTAVLAVATGLVITANLDSWAWVTIAAISIFGREALKVIKDLRK